MMSMEYDIFEKKKQKHDIGYCNVVSNPTLHSKTIPFNVNENVLLDYANQEHLSYIKWMIRYNYNSKKKFSCNLGDNIFILTDMVSVFVNMRIFTILNSYEVTGNKSALVFEYSYMKGEPKKYISKVADYIFNSNTKDKEMFTSYILSEIKEVFYELSVIVNGTQSLEHSLFGYIEAYSKYLWFKNALDNPVISKEDTPFEIDRKVKVIKDNLAKSHISPLSDLMTMGVKNNPEQSAAFICYGFTPNWNDINHCRSIIVGGYLNGFRCMEDFFLNDNNGRIATIKGKSDVKEPGVLGKEVSTAVSSDRLNAADTRKIVHDCKSKYYFPITIRNEKDLEFYRYKYYYDTKKHKRLGWIDIDRKDLIGKDLFVRTIMLCECENQICEECFGYNAKLCQDTNIQKFDAYIYVSSLVSQKMQGVISVKHHLAAKLAPMTVSYGDIRDMNLEEFLKQSDIITKMEFDILHFNKKYDIRFENYNVNKWKEDVPSYQKSAFPQYEAGMHGRLFVNDIEFETVEALKKIDDYTYKITIPNISVISAANDLSEALRSHGEFDVNKKMSGKPILEQLRMVYDFIETRLSLPAFIYYEILIHALTIDANDVSSKVTGATKALVHISSRNATNKSKKYIHPNIAEGLVHGYFNKAIANVNACTNPAVFDIAYAHINDRDGTFYNMPENLNKIIMDKFPDIVKK